jgi:hypothetical protein
MVKIPMRKSATGRVKVSGRKDIQLASSNKLIVISSKNKKSPDAFGKGTSKNAFCC